MGIAGVIDRIASSTQNFLLFPMVLSVSLMAVSILSEYERIVLFSSQLSISNFLSKMSC